MSAELRRIAATEVEEFKADYAWRFPGRSVDEVSADRCCSELCCANADVGLCDKWVVL
jgi:hypothetical protein